MGGGAAGRVGWPCKKCHLSLFLVVEIKYIYLWCSTLSFIRLLNDYDNDSHRLFIKAKIHNNIIMATKNLVDQFMHEYYFSG
jgi:hypothetical protein